MGQCEEGPHINVLTVNIDLLITLLCVLYTVSAFILYILARSFFFSSAKLNLLWRKSLKKNAVYLQKLIHQEEN